MKDFPLRQICICIQRYTHVTRNSECIESILRAPETLDVNQVSRLCIVHCSSCLSLRLRTVISRVIIRTEGKTIMVSTRTVGISHVDEDRDWLRSHRYICIRPWRLLRAHQIWGDPGARYLDLYFSLRAATRFRLLADSLFLSPSPFRLSLYFSNSHTFCIVILPWIFQLFPKPYLESGQANLSS